MTDLELEEILLDVWVVRNRLKIYSVRKNALVALQIQKEFGSLDKYLWNYVSWIQIINYGATMYDFPTESTISQSISKDLKKRGMSFVGSTIIYAFMQAVGMVDDHMDTCWRKK